MSSLSLNFVWCKTLLHLSYFCTHFPYSNIFIFSDLFCLVIFNIYMQNLQGIRPNIKPSTFFGLILQPNYKNLWSMAHKYLVFFCEVKAEAMPERLYIHTKENNNNNKHFCVLFEFSHKGFS